MSNKNFSHKEMQRLSEAYTSDVIREAKIFLNDYFFEIVPVVALKNRGVSDETIEYMINVCARLLTCEVENFSLKTKHYFKTVNEDVNVSYDLVAELMYHYLETLVTVIWRCFNISASRFPKTLIKHQVGCLSEFLQSQSDKANEVGKRLRDIGNEN